MEDFRKLLDQISPHDTQIDMLLKGMELAHNNAIEMCLENVILKFEGYYDGEWKDDLKFDPKCDFWIDKDSIEKLKV